MSCESSKHSSQFLLQPLPWKLPDRFPSESDLPCTKPKCLHHPRQLVHSPNQGNSICAFFAHLRMDSRMDRQKASYRLPVGKTIGCRPCLADTFHRAGLVSLHNGHHLGPREGSWHQLVFSEPNHRGALALLPGSGTGSSQLLGCMSFTPNNLRR